MRVQAEHAGYFRPAAVSAVVWQAKPVRNEVQPISEAREPKTPPANVLRNLERFGSQQAESDEGLGNIESAGKQTVAKDRQTRALRL